ncbi:MAG: hypothetical protein P8Y23_10185, partial [Candidatus Lokiarchaeota archaeon]
MIISRRKILQLLSSISLSAFIPEISYSHNANFDKPYILFKYLSNMETKKDAQAIGEQYLL